MRTGLSRLLRPRTLAVIGGGTWCANVIQACMRMGFEGEIWPVHPTKSEIAGRKTFARVADLPAGPDASFIGVNRTATLDCLTDLNAGGAGGAVCFASGFAEAQAELADGGDLQSRLLSAAGDVAVLGPNCYGLLNYLDKAAIWPDQHGGRAVTSGVAIVTQSSNIAINLTMQTRGVPIGYVVTAGNQAQTDIAEIGIELLRDPRVTCLGLHIEGIKDIRALEDLAHVAHELNKPVAVIKIGHSEAARTATVSHTASLAGSAAGSDALFQRLGFAQARNLPVFLELLKLWHVAGSLPHGRIASASCSGGEASLIADTAEGTGVDFPPLTQKQMTHLRAALGPKVALANPLDYHTYIWPDTQAMSATFTAMMQADLALGIVVLDFPRSDRCDASEWDNVIEAVRQTTCDTGKTMAIVSSLGETLPETVSENLIAQGIVPLCGMDHAIAAIALARTSPKHSSPVLLPILAKAQSLVPEDRAKQMLSSFGLRTPKSKVVNAAQIQNGVPDDLQPPFVLKATGLAHKSDVGGVRVGLASAEAVSEAAKDMSFDAYLIEEMVENALFELLIGVTVDPAHGYVLTLGAGGTRTEILNDTVSLLLPVTQQEISDALSKLHHAPVLFGFRGAPACSIESIWHAVEAVQRFVIAHHGQVSEIEINPILCTKNSAVAVDALLMMGEPK